MRIKGFVPGGRIKVLRAEKPHSRERVTIGRSVNRKRVMISVLHKPRLNELHRGRFMKHHLTSHSATRGGMVLGQLVLTLPEATALLRLLSDVLFQIFMERRQQTR